MTPTSPKITEIDRELLRLLQENSRRTNKDLAESVGVAQSTCLERIRSLTDRGIIAGWTIEVNPSKIGLEVRALIHVRLQPKTTESVHQFQHEMLAHKEVLVISTITGADDFILEVAVADVSHLRDFVLEQITSRANVTDARTSLIYEQVRTRVIEPYAFATEPVNAPSTKPARSPRRASATRRTTDTKHKSD